MNQQLSYEVLISDQSGSTEIASVKSLAMGLSYSDKLWKEVELKDQASISDNQLGISLHLTKVGDAFLIKVTGKDIASLAAFRKPLATHVFDRLKFTNINLIKDEVVQFLENTLYPQIKNVESALKGVLSIKMVQEYGVNWWESMLPKELEVKKDTFANKGLYVLSFDELTILFLEKDISSKVFKTNDVAKKWKNLFDIQQKLVNAEAFTSKEVEEVKILTDDLQTLISGQVSKTTLEIKRTEVNNVEVKKEQSKVETVEKEVKVSVKETPKAEEKSKPKNDMSEFISEQELIKELKIAESKDTSFVNLKMFVMEDLVNKGYAFGPAYSLSKNLDENGKVEIYDAKDENGAMIKAIRSL